ncbi:cytochrome P450 [Marinitenerispora sediminis]|uniref:Cytochrome P450 n=1 Tax=Marinitenerispora sediminis TaxID=1931232 RepID=A0A368SZF9_9ACTN|nr:cytochrome P450 [Marinitenerispora sediminis]RCV48378.1 cytochrome P450 [Marinitenerispora sediminis]RCV50705.1 cytochrome P450 [Marinitenerispora sediminis]RCV51311.1 cytochrome P450 [Marinitenerispora sediminis]
MRPTDRLPRYPFSDRGDRLAPELADLVRTCPVARVRTNSGDPAWLVTGHAEIRQVTRSPRFARSQAGDPGSPVQDTPILAPELMGALDYLRRAGLLDEVRRALGREQPDWPDAWVRATAREGLEAMVRTGQPGDLQRHFAEWVAGRALCRVIGLPPDDLPRLAEWADTDLTMCIPAEVVAENWARLRDYLLDRAADRSRLPHEGLLFRLADRNTGPGRLDDRQLANIAAVLFVSGYEDLASLLGVAAINLLRRPEAVRDLREHPDRMPRHVEELLRVSVVLGNGLARIVTEDTELGGAALSRGDLVLLSTDAANFDPEAFPGPDDFDPDRAPNPHMRFGHGPHYCPGAYFSRRVTELAFGVLLDRLPHVALAVPPEQIPWCPDRMAIMPARIPVRW